MLRTLTRKVTLASLVFWALMSIAAAFTVMSIYAIDDVAHHLSEHTFERTSLSLRFSASLSRAIAEIQSFA
jgi:hypothetical protein